VNPAASSDSTHGSSPSTTACGFLPAAAAVASAYSSLHFFGASTRNSRWSNASPEAVTSSRGPFGPSGAGATWWISRAASSAVASSRSSSSGCVGLAKYTAAVAFSGTSPLSSSARG
jgi:hypothetical protein